ncbi:MAG: branched-chain amino acid ABC transporter permease [Nitrososphaerota archaeon]|nr:branched-chain amino acid ABC transporter permease [Nitrososphaerota archaeon]MDG6938940.1 branched-chain amino acid ABC transporter permease [Nitrososphaerota archaeon]
MLLVELIVLGVAYGLLYGVLALGLTLVWGVMKVANIAHGDFVTIGAYASYWLFVLSGVNPILSLLFTIPFGFALGAASYLTLVRRVVDSPELMPLFMTFGLSTLISSLLLYLYSPTQRGVPISFAPLDGLGVILPGGVAIAATYAVVAAVALRLFLQKTFLGKAIRAVMENRASATLMGINPGRVGLISFGIGISIATSVGSMIVLLQSFTPLMGGDFTLLSFVIVVLGGLGSPIGALVGGVVLGVVENIASLWLNAAVTPAIGFVVLVIVLIVRPYGLMGSK